MNEFKAISPAIQNSIHLLEIKSNKLTADAWNNEIKPSLNEFSELQFLVLHECEGLKQDWLSELPHIKHLRLKDLPKTVENLSLSGCEVTNEGLNSALRNLPRLRKVNVFISNELDDSVRAGVPESVVFIGLGAFQKNVSNDSPLNPSSVFDPEAISLPAF